MKITDLFKKKSVISPEEDIYKDRYVDKPKKQKSAATTLSKAMVCLFVVVLVVVAVIGLYYLKHFYFYNEYENYVSEYDYEESRAFTPLADSEAGVENMVLAAESDYLKLYTNLDTAEVAVFDKRTGAVTYSNPRNLEDDTIANETNKNYLRSQIVLEYFNSGRTSGILDSYSSCVSTGKFEISAIDNGIRCTYLMGDTSSLTGIVPRYIRQGVLSSVTSKLSDEEAQIVNDSYSECASIEGFMELNNDCIGSMSKIRELNGYFEEAEFSNEDFATELTEAGKGNLLIPGFAVDLDYRLDGDSLVVSVPMSSVLEGGGASIYRIQLLRYFGAGSSDEEGYMMVPNGCGSIINFNNGKTNQADYSQYVYGLDPLSQDYTVIENTQAVRLPVFGIEKEDATIFAQIEEGETLSLINASISGKTSNYNFIYNTFILRGYDLLAMFGSTGNEAELPIVEKNYYDVNLTLRYSFLDEEHKGYAGMANYYRDKLVADGILTERTTDAELPFYMDVIGGVKATSHVLGIRYYSNMAMTTFAEAEEISSDLAANGIGNQVMNFQGWFNGGYYHDVIDKLNITGKLGGRRGLESLSNTVVSNGGRFYGDVAINRVTRISKRFIPELESSRYYGAGYVASFGAVNPSTLRQTASLGYDEIRFNMLSPKFVPRYVNSFARNVGKVDIEGISLRDLGDVLASDKKRSNVINREEALDVILGQFDTLSNTGKNLMVSGGNEYSFAYANDIINAPVIDSDFFIVDDSVPFYEMVIHGYIDYSGDAMNIGSSANVEKDILNLIECGAAPHYTFTHNDASDMKYTGLNNLYATTYSNWKDEAVETYNYMNEALASVQGATIINHQILSSDVRKITYDNGQIIYINYGDEPVSVDGVTVNALSYSKGGMN